MSAFAAWLIGFSKSVLIWLYNHGIDFVQIAMDSFVDFILLVITLFPSATDMPQLPVVPTGPEWVFFINVLNWLFPIGFFLQVVTFVGGAIIAYVTIMPLARWLKLLN